MTTDMLLRHRTVVTVTAKYDDGTELTWVLPDDDHRVNELELVLGVPDTIVLGHDWEEQ
jgi:hypothetical protein